MLEFLSYSLLAGLGIALAAGPLGTFVVWRRMAYFGDTLSHSALLGVALGLLFSTSVTFAVMSVSLVIAIALTLLQNNRWVATDTLLGILSHGGLSIGMLVVSLFVPTQVDLQALLFGDLLAVTKRDLLWIGITSALVITTLVALWRPLLSCTVHEELAAIEGLPVKLLRFCLMVMIALTIAITMKIVGVLLITALLIIPAAAARFFAKTPEAMAIIASLIACASVLSGIFLAFSIDTPAGPTIVTLATAWFFLTAILKNIRQ